MTREQVGLQAAGAWLAGASILLVLTLVFHGPLHPDLSVQMTRIGASASRWAVVHWTAAAAFSAFAIAAVLVLVSPSPLVGTAKTISAWAVILVGALWTLTTAVAEVAVIAWNEYRRPQRLVPKWSAGVGTGAGLASCAGWVLGVWFGVGPAIILWLVGSGIMSAWLAWLGILLSRGPSHTRAVVQH